MKDTCGQNSIEPFASYDQESSSWRTSQLSFDHPSGKKYSGPWPKQGTMQDGLVFGLQTLELRTEENEFLLLPTPKAMETRSSKENPNWNPGMTLTDAIILLLAPTAGDDTAEKRSHKTLTTIGKLSQTSTGGSTSQQSEDGNASQEKPQPQSTTKESSLWDSWNG